MAVVVVKIAQRFAAGDIVDQQIEPGDHGGHVRGPVGGFAFDAIHDQPGDAQGYLRFQLARAGGWTGGFFDRQFDPVLLLGYQGGDIFAGEGPVHAGAEVEDIGGAAEGFALDLFGGDVIRGALNAGLDGADAAALAQVDDTNRAVFGDNDIVRLDVTMDKTVMVHAVKALGDHAEDQQQIQEAVAGGLLERGAGAILHKQEYLVDLQ